MKNPPRPTPVRVLSSDDPHTAAALATIAEGPNSGIVVGDSRSVLRHVPDDSVRCCVTSPPYWSLRDYRIPGQIGLEAQLADYFASLVAVFEEVRRVLTSDGTLWLNIGDAYTSGGRTWRAPDKKNPVRAMTV